MRRGTTERTSDDVALPLVGGHISSAAGWSEVPGRALAAGAEVVQVFSSNPRIWPLNPPDVQALTEFAATLREHHLPLFLHAVYLINPASPDEGLRARSTAALAHALMTAGLAGAAGLVTHLGSHRGEGFERAAPWVTESIVAAQTLADRDLKALDSLAELPLLLLETAAGSGATVGATLMELQALLELLPHPAPDHAGPQTGLCLDTAHMFAAGYAVHDTTGLTTLVSELEQCDLLRRVGLIHLNDSASLFASKRDRHANPGLGELGYAGLARVVTHPAFRHVPFVLEVPGSDGHGPGALEVNLVKKMRQEPPGPPLPARGPEIVPRVPG
jgi:deoxyribonuclease-4